MRPTETLSDEHRVIEQVLSCLEKIADRASSSGALDLKSAREAIDFIQVFADTCHHGKEENHLFPALERRGFSRTEGPTSVMRAEHETGRSHVRAMAQAVQAASLGQAEGVPAFIREARPFVSLLRDHIMKEEHCLFAMANAALGFEEQEALSAAFEKVEVAELGAGTHEKYLGIANRLADRFGVARVAGAASGHGGCCGHH